MNEFFGSPNAPELCGHFGRCGGCALQDLPDRAYRERKRAEVVRALANHGVEGSVEQIAAVGPRTRRRASFKARKSAGETAIGFHASGSHTIVDMRECRVLTPGLFELVGGLRPMLSALLEEGEAAELHATESEVGFDLELRWQRRSSPALVQELAHWASRLNVARITAGRQILVALDVPMVRFGRARVALPPDSFLQPTEEGERILQTRVTDALRSAKHVADLFSGCGTFTFPLAERSSIHAVELDPDALGALTAASRSVQGLKPITAEKRDLFLNPLRRSELARYEAVVLDPPRAGAERQSRELAGSSVARIAYVSCNVESFARDARILVDAGLRLASVVPVDQFLWSEHIELVAAFERRRGG